MVDATEGPSDCTVELEEGVVDVEPEEETVDDSFTLGPAVDEETAVFVVEVDVEGVELVDGKEEATEVDVSSF